MVHPTHKEHDMAYGRGHVKGTKKERKGASDWYRAIQVEHLKRIEAEWKARQQGK